MTPEEVLQMIIDRRDAISHYNGEDEFAVKVLNRLIKEIESML